MKSQLPCLGVATVANDGLRLLAAWQRPKIYKISAITSYTFTFNILPLLLTLNSVKDRYESRNFLVHRPKFTNGTEQAPSY